MYIGPIERMPRQALCADHEMKISMRTVQTSIGEEHMFKEGIGNIADNVQRSRENNIEPGYAEITMDPHRMTLKNYGMFIPIDRHPQTGKWVHEMVFGTFRAGSNFDDSKERLYIGQNGIGAKGVNGFSLEFTVRGGDSVRGLMIEITWYNNMSSMTEPKITQYSGPGFTEISYVLDFQRFGVPCYDEEIVDIYRAHCAGLSLACQIPIIFNGTTISVQSLFDYAKLFFPLTKSSAIQQRDPKGMYDLCIVDTPNQAVGISFVNGVVTPLGGAHLDAAYKVVTHTLIDSLGKSVAGVTLTKRDIVDHVSVFISCRLAKPKFSSQTKEQLKSPEPKIELPAKTLEGIKRWQLVEIIYNEIARKQITKLKATDGKRKKERGGKVEHANWAGKSRSAETVFILTEGDSADSYRLKFVSQMPNGQGRNIFGSMPLRGKIRNVIKSTFLKILNDVDFIAIKKHLGLAEDVDYTIPANYKKLNYGQLWYFPDPDNDGKHITGLLLLYFMARFPSLIKIGYLKFLRIPIARVPINGVRKLFYSMNALKKTLAELPPGSTVGEIEYFKGLGSSTDEHISEDFENPRLVTFQLDDEAFVNMKKAFDKDEAEVRKEWILDWVNKELCDVEDMPMLPVSHFVNHELIDYSIENVIRAIPEMYDGLKESQRKIMYTFMKKTRGKAKTIKYKVAELAGYASGMTCYRHGEKCLADAIIKMTQSFVGSNNLPYFTAHGQFGTRNKGGKDACDGRYIFVSKHPLMNLIYRPEDLRLEKRIMDEGKERECENLFPIICMQLMNGSKGVGSGWSTDTPCYNPREATVWLMIRNILQLEPESGHVLPKLLPYYKGFKGEIIMREKKNGFITKGIMRVIDNDTFEITELPIGVWIKDYDNYLAELEKEGLIQDYDTFSTDANAHFVVKGYKERVEENGVEVLKPATPTLQKLGLITSFSFNNMTMLYRDAERNVHPKIYSDVNSMLEDFYLMRLQKYYERHDLIIKELEKDIVDLTDRARYIQYVIEGKFVYINREETDVYRDMDNLNLPHFLLGKVRSSEQTKNGLQRLFAVINKKKAELEEIKQKKPEHTYYNELKEFLEGFDAHEKDEETNASKKRARRRTAAR